MNVDYLFLKKNYFLRELLKLYKMYRIKIRVNVNNIYRCAKPV